MSSTKELVGRYRELINNNADIVTGFEGVLKSALYILPSQLGGDAEVHSEAAYSVVSMISLVHDLIFMGQLRKKITALQALRRAVSSRSNPQKRTSFTTEPNPLNKQLQVTFFLFLLFLLVVGRETDRIETDASAKVVAGRRNHTLDSGEFSRVVSRDVGRKLTPF